MVAFFASAMSGQGRSAITGRVADSSGAVLQGARVELQPRGIVTATNSWGEFTFANVPPCVYGDYFLRRVCDRYPGGLGWDKSG